MDTPTPLPDSPEPSPSQKMPAILCARIATLASVTGKPCGARADVAFAATIDIPAGGPDPRMDEEARIELTERLRFELAFHFEMELRRHMRAAHPDAFSHESERVDIAYASQAMRAMPAASRAFPFFFCATVDDRAWGLSKLDDRHWSFASDAEAAASLPPILMAALASMEPALAEAGIRMTLAEPMLVASEARLDGGACMPTIPFSSMSGGHWGQGSVFMRELGARACALAEAREISDGAPLAPTRAKKPFSI